MAGIEEKIQLSDAEIDQALEAQYEREQGWLDGTSQGRSGPIRDLYAPDKPVAKQAPKPPLVNWIERLSADPGEVQDALDDPRIQALPAAQRIEAAARLSQSETLLLEGRYQDALAVAVGGENLDANVMASMLREISPDSFDAWTLSRSAEVEQQTAQAVADEIEAGVKRNPSLQDEAGSGLLAEMLATAGVVGDEPAEKIRQLVDTAARAADRARIEETHDAIRQAVEQSVVDTPGATMGTDGNEVWPIPGDPSPAEREFQHQRDQLARIGTAALTSAKSHEAQVEEDWQSTVGQDEAQAAEWEQVQEAAQNAAAEAEAEDHARGIV